MGRAPCCDEKLGLKKGPWTPDEDAKLVAFIQQHGHGSWRALPEKAGLARCGKSCRLRWTNYLRPDIKRGRFSHEEDQTIIHLHGILGNRWSAIASHLPRRTDNEIKNYWNTHLKKRLGQMGTDHPLARVTTTPPLVSTHLSHISQWGCALQEAQARLRPFPAPTSTPNHPSSLFMRAWAKASVPDPPSKSTFRALKLEPAHMKMDYSTPFPKPVSRPQRARQDWDTALGLQRWQFGLMAPLVPLVDEPEMVFDNLAREELSFEERFSPQSVLQSNSELVSDFGGEDGGGSSSPCGSSSVSDCFDLILHHNSSGLQSFPELEMPGGGVAMEQDGGAMGDGDAFWERQSEAGLELVSFDFNHGEGFSPFGSQYQTFVHSE